MPIRDVHSRENDCRFRADDQCEYSSREADHEKERRNGEKATYDSDSANEELAPDVVAGAADRDSKAGDGGESAHTSGNHEYCDHLWMRS